MASIPTCAGLPLSAISAQMMMTSGAGRRGVRQLKQLQAAIEPHPISLFAQLGLFEVHRRVIEGEEPMPAAAGAPQGILTRMLVCHSQAGSIIGK